MITTPAIDQLEAMFGIRFTSRECELLTPACQLDAYDHKSRRLLLAALQTSVCPACGHIICQRSAAGMPLETCPATVRHDDDYSCPDLDCRAALTWHLEPLSGSQWFTATYPNAVAIADAERRFPRQAGELEDPPRHPDSYPYGEPWGPDNPAPGSPWGKAMAARRLGATPGPATPGVTVAAGVTRDPGGSVLGTYAAYAEWTEGPKLSLIQWEGWQRQIHGLAPGDTAGTAYPAVWAAWNALPDDCPAPVKTIAAMLTLDPANVAAIVYPGGTQGQFGAWDPGQEPDLAEDPEPDETNEAGAEYDPGDEADDEGGASEYRNAAAWADVDRAEHERDGQ